jgi:hypothetical protein
MSVPLVFDRRTGDPSIGAPHLGVAVDAGWQPVPQRSLALAIVFAAAATVAVVVLVDVVLLLTVGSA